jgi:hypothetical protein
MSEPLVVYVDVDDTLVRSVGSKRIPMPAVVEHVRALDESGALLYCWSTGGAAYAESTASELGIADCFSGFLPKPNVIIDDQDVAEWRGCIEVGPIAVSGAKLDRHVQALAVRRSGPT